MVRGLALRSICSLKLESMLEYMEQPLKKCLTDVSPYVRKTAVLGILKVSNLLYMLCMPDGSGSCELRDFTHSIVAFSWFIT